MSVLKEIEDYLALKSRVRRALDIALAECRRQSKAGRDGKSVSDSFARSATGNVLCQNSHQHRAEGP